LRDEIIVTVQEAIGVLESHGWRSVEPEGDYRRLRHEASGRTITVAGKPQVVVPAGVLRALWRFAQITEPG